MHLAVAGVFRPLWRNRVQDEWMAALLRDRPHLDAARLAHRRTLMDTYIYDARVTGCEPLIDDLVLPDPDDRHVLAGRGYTPDQPREVRQSPLRLADLRSQTVRQASNSLGRT